MIKKYWVVIFLSSLALLCNSIASFQYYSSHQLVTTGATTHGTVVRIESSGTRKGGSVNHPVVRFATNDGKVIEGRGNLGTRPSQYQQGDTVQVFYDKSDPNRWLINNFGELYFMTLIFGIFGVVLTLVSGGMLFCMVTGRRFPGTFRGKRG